MTETSRRRLLHRAGGLVLAGLAGCVAGPSDNDGTTPTTTGSKPPDGGLTGWERSTDCDRTPTGMYDSIIRVEAVRETVPEGYVPIDYAALTPAERTVLETVTEVGGYGIRDTGEGFDRFVDRVSETVDRQAAAEELRVYLRRNDTYYRLYVEKADQVFAY